MTYPFIRKAEPKDYDALWSIWMQAHVIQWMSFTKQTKEDFVSHYKRMQDTSDIYVLIDKVKDEEKVVAVRRIKFGKNEYAHTAEYCSMGVDATMQGKGHAKFFYQEFEKIARDSGVKRIQLTQSGGNEAAFHLADRDFIEEAVFPDWLKRSNNDGDFYLIERYIYRFLDKKLEVLAKELPSLKYQEMLAPMQPQKEMNSMTIQREFNRFICRLGNKALITVDFEPDTSVIQHIGFLSIQLHAPKNQSEVLVGLRVILIDILEENRVKKLELFTSDPLIATLCRNLGFFVRGEKIASFCDKEGYKNELGVEYSFFDIADANQLIKAKISDLNKRDGLHKALTKCSNTIQSLVDNKDCDKFAARYLENIVYQMVRDDLGANKIISLSETPWAPLLSQIPRSLYNDVAHLSCRLQNLSITFFKKDKANILSELPFYNVNDLSS